MGEYGFDPDIHSYFGSRIDDKTGDSPRFVDIESLLFSCARKESGSVDSLIDCGVSLIFEQDADLGT